MDKPFHRRLPVPLLFGVLASLFHAGVVAGQETGLESTQQKALDRIKEARGHARQERYSRALGDLRVAVAFAEQADRTKLTLALALHNMAEVYRLQGRAVDALKTYHQALLIYTELDHKPAIAITQAQIDAVLPDSKKQRSGADVASSTAAGEMEGRLDRIDKAVERIRKRLQSDTPSGTTPSAPPSEMAPSSIELSKSSPRLEVERSHASYAESVRQTINRGWRYPPSAKSKHQEGTVEIEFSILSNGELDSIHILQSSGFMTLDMESIRSVREAAPFEAIPLPKGKPHATVRLLFNYKLPETGRTKLKAQAAPSSPASY